MWWYDFFSTFVFFTFKISNGSLLNLLPSDNPHKAIMAGTVLLSPSVYSGSFSLARYNMPQLKKKTTNNIYSGFIFSSSSCNYYPFPGKSLQRSHFHSLSLHLPTLPFLKLAPTGLLSPYSTNDLIIMVTNDLHIATANDQLGSSS